MTKPLQFTAGSALSTTDPIGTALVEKLRKHAGYFREDGVNGSAEVCDEAADALESRIAEGEAMREALRRIETGECVTDWADQPHEQMQEEARAALSLHRRPT